MECRRVLSCRLVDTHLLTDYYSSLFWRVESFYSSFVALFQLFKLMFRGRAHNIVNRVEIKKKTGCFSCCFPLRCTAHGEDVTLQLSHFSPTFFPNLTSCCSIFSVRPSIPAAASQQQKIHLLIDFLFFFCLPNSRRTNLVCFFPLFTIPNHKNGGEIGESGRIVKCIKPEGTISHAIGTTWWPLSSYQLLS